MTATQLLTLVEDNVNNINYSVQDLSEAELRLVYLGIITKLTNQLKNYDRWVLD